MLSPEAVFQYKCDAFYAPESEGAVAWDDPALAIPWPLRPTGSCFRTRTAATRSFRSAGRCLITIRITMLDILITGAGGQLGREMQRLSAVSPNHYVATDLPELDITDRDAVLRSVGRSGAQVIVNCAAYTDVERAEEDAAAADLINHRAAAYLAEAALETGATLIHVSTDYVFDGRSCVPYTEEAAPAPQSVYGRTKRAGEEAVIASGCKYLIFRTAWLYSAWGRNFLKTMLRLTAERETLRVVCDQVGTPTYAGDLALGIFSIIESGLYKGNEGIYHFTDEGVCSWYDFAVEIAAAAGHTRCRIEPCRTEEYPTRAVRPAYSVLDRSKLKHTFGIEIPHWRESMLYCLRQIGQTEPELL